MLYQATHSDRKQVIDILSKAFDQNSSVNYIIRQDPKRTARVRALMAYSFDVCSRYGAVYLSPERKGCLLLLYPEKKKSTLLLDMKLILQAIGIKGISKAMRREAVIKKAQVSERNCCYLWYIAVDPEVAGKGIGTAMMKDLIELAADKPILLETSVVRNLSCYKQFGFIVYNTIYLGYKLHFMRRP